MPSLDPVSPGSPRRIVLIDFDWQDADLLPELLRHPGVDVRLVAGPSADDPGVRVAELCGVPRTLELADLARERFDLALLGERSSRRELVAGVLEALDLPLVSPRAFVGDMRGVERRHPQAPAASTAELGGDDMATLIDLAIPDLEASGVTRREEVAAAPRGRSMPRPIDREGLEAMIVELARETGASAAALLVKRGGTLEREAGTGPDDPLLRSLGEAALELDAPQVVWRAGTTPMRLWGAWPFRSADHTAVLLAGGLPSDREAGSWEQATAGLREAWERDAAEIARSPEHRFRNAWLTPAEFRSRIRLAVERHQRDGLRFAIHRLHLGGRPGAVEALCRRLPDHLRGGDCLCHPAPGVVLLLLAGSQAEFAPVRARLEEVWGQCCGGPGEPPPPIGDERIELISRADADVFVSAASGWLAAR